MKSATSTENGKRPAWVRWYKTANWYRLRYWQLKRSPVCEFCKEKGIVEPANTVDHIAPHKGDVNKFFDRNNLQSLCKSCHSSVKQRIEKTGEFGCDRNGYVPAWR